MEVSYLASIAKLIWTKYSIKYSRVKPQGAVHAFLSRHIWVYSLRLYSFSSSYVMYFLHFLLTQLFRDSVDVAHILRFRKRRWKATQITAGQDSDIACGLAVIFLCISVIMELPPHARHSHYWIIIRQMSVWLTLTGWSVSKSPSPIRLQSRYLCLGECCI